jgi:hypothetical protein
MLTPRLLSAALALFEFALASAGNAPAPQRSLPAGEWSVEFANGVVETCAIRKDGTASESEPNRKTDGKPVDKDGALVITFDDDRTERWTPSANASSSSTGIRHPNTRAANRCAASRIGSARRVAIFLAPIAASTTMLGRIRSRRNASMAPCVHRRDFLRLGLLGAVGFATEADPPSSLAAEEGELLYNGIRLPKLWPPALKELPAELPTPAYIKDPPAVIPIDVGRQLFVDDFLIAKTTLTRTHHRPAYHSKNPVLTGGMVFSDGVWYDPEDKTFKMWYMAKGGTAYATSKDGVTWEKPELDVQKSTNLVQTSPRDSNTVWLDLEEKDPKKRYKMFRSYSRPEQKSWCLWIHFSHDGIHWSDPEPTGPCGDRTTVFYNPFRKVWVYSLRNGPGAARCRRYWEARADVVKDAQWGAYSDPPLWCGSDKLDLPRDDYKVTPELYNLDAVAYESILLGLFTIWRGQFPERPKPNEVCVGYSRDGWSWTRPDRRGFCPVSETKGEWNYGNVQSAGGCCLVVGDELYFYCSGRGVGNVTSLAVLRRDGFTSMDAGDKEGTLTTRPVTFKGKYLFVNADVSAGELRCELLDEQGEIMAPFGAANCKSVRADKTLQRITWKDPADLGNVVGKTVRFRFLLTNGKLYSFWVSNNESGASKGYVAAGGPGHNGLTDTIGKERR